MSFRCRDCGSHSYPCACVGTAPLPATPLPVETPEQAAQRVRDFGNHLARARARFAKQRAWSWGLRSGRLPRDLLTFEQELAHVHAMGIASIVQRALKNSASVHVTPSVDGPSAQRRRVVTTHFSHAEPAR